MSKGRSLNLTSKQLDLVHKFIWNYCKRFSFTNEQHWESYRQWSKGSEVTWHSIQQGGTGIMIVLKWYHYIYKPGSREHRAKIIINALLKEVERLEGELT